MEPELQGDAPGDLETQRASALIEMDVPLADAKRYLSLREYEYFRQTLAPAADAYLAGRKGSLPGDYRLDPRTIANRAWIMTIDERKQAPAKRRQAKADYDQFILEINHEISQFKQQLESERRPDFAYHPTLARYRPDSWCSLQLPTPEEVTKWAAPHVEKKLPPDLAGLVALNVRGEALTLPRARFELRGSTPCLLWRFTIRVLATVEIRLTQTTFTREFRGYEYPIDVDAQGLGHCYVGPASWDRQEGFAVPLILLAALARGALEDAGVVLAGQDSSSMRFLVQGYDGEVAISTKFFQFITDICKERPLAEGLLAAGVTDRITARIVQKKVIALPSPAAAGAPAGEASDDNREVEARLESMGYKETDVKKMIESLQVLPGMSIEDRIKEALKSTQT